MVQHFEMRCWHVPFVHVHRHEKNDATSKTKKIKDFQLEESCDHEKTV